MGKQIVQTVVWGIKVDDEQALLIKNTLEPQCSEGCGFYIKSPTKRLEVALKTDGCQYGESISYSQWCDHVFGVAYSEDIVKGVKETPEKVKEEYKSYARPFLKSLGIKGSPKVLVITQVM